MRGPSRRPEQVAQTVRQVVADALLGELRDPRIGFATVTSVQVTRDLSHATVHVSVMGEPADRERAMAGLESATGFLRAKVGKVMTGRTVPELHFELDRGLEHAQRINEILGEIRGEGTA